MFCSALFFHIPFEFSFSLHWKENLLLGCPCALLCANMICSVTSVLGCFCVAVYLFALSSLSLFSLCPSISSLWSFFHHLFASLFLLCPPLLHWKENLFLGCPCALLCANRICSVTSVLGCFCVAVYLFALSSLSLFSLCPSLSSLWSFFRHLFASLFLLCLPLSCLCPPLIVNPL